MYSEYFIIYTHHVCTGIGWCDPIPVKKQAGSWAMWASVDHLQGWFFQIFKDQMSLASPDSRFSLWLLDWTFLEHMRLGNGWRRPWCDGDWDVEVAHSLQKIQQAAPWYLSPGLWGEKGETMIFSATILPILSSMFLEYMYIIYKIIYIYVCVCVLYIICICCAIFCEAPVVHRFTRWAACCC